MLLSGICSSARGTLTRCVIAMTAAGALFSVPVAARAQTITQDEALRLAFPAPLRVERHTAYLTAEQLRRATAMAGHTVTQSVVTYYLARDARGIAGIAYFDSHRVRTHGEVLMFVVGADARIKRTEVLHFAEPREYRAPDRWLDLFDERPLNSELSLKRDIPNITGATLTAQAVTNAARRVLALHHVINPFAR